MTQACNPSHSGLRPEDHKIVFSWGTLARPSQYKRAGDTAQWSSACLHMPDPSSVLEKKSPFAVQRKLKGVKRGRKEELWNSPGKRGRNVFTMVVDRGSYMKP